MMEKPKIIISRHGLYSPAGNGLSRITNLLELANTYQNKKIEIFVSPNLSFIENINIFDSKSADLAVKRALSEKTPNAENLIWSTKTVFQNSEQKETLVFALESDFFREFAAVMDEQKIAVSSYSSLAHAITNQVSDDQPYLLIFVQGEIVFLLAKINHQIYTQQIEKLANLKSELVKFITQVETDPKNKINTLYECSDRDLSSLGLMIKALPVNFSKLQTDLAIDPKLLLQQPS